MEHAHSVPAADPRLRIDHARRGHSPVAAGLLGAGRGPIVPRRPLRGDLRDQHVGIVRRRHRQLLLPLRPDRSPRDISNRRYRLHEFRHPHDVRPRNQGIPQDEPRREGIPRRPGSPRVEEFLPLRARLFICLRARRDRYPRGLLDAGISGGALDIPRGVPLGVHVLHRRLRAFPRQPHAIPPEHAPERHHHPPFPGRRHRLLCPAGSHHARHKQACRPAQVQIDRAYAARSHRYCDRDIGRDRRHSRLRALAFDDERLRPDDDFPLSGGLGLDDGRIQLDRHRRDERSEPDDSSCS